MKKAIPYLFILVLFVVAWFVKQGRNNENTIPNSPSVTQGNRSASSEKRNDLDVFRDPDAEYFFTKHARCRMECRSITQKEVKEIVRKADVNYTKSDLNATQGSKYALEGYTSTDQQHIRVIVAPKKKHLSIVTVIDLDKEWGCPDCR